MTDPESTKRPPRKRIKSLTQAALNADVTLENLDEVLNHLLGSLDGLDKSIESLDTTLTTFNGALDKLDGILSRLEGLVSRVEGIVGGVGIRDSVLAPWSATEAALRSWVGVVRKSTGL